MTASASCLNRHMRILIGFIALISWVALPVLQVSGDKGSPPLSQSAYVSNKTRTETGDVYGKLPLIFEANAGQVGAEVKYIARASGYTVFLTPGEASLRLRVAGREARERVKRNADRHEADRSLLASQPATIDVLSSTLTMKLLGANPAPRMIGLDELAGKSNYFVGKNSRNWRTNVPTYKKVKCEGVYPGIDVIYYGNGRRLEYDFIVAPGADPAAIRLGFDNTRAARIDDKGDLLIETGVGEIRQRKPFAYQEEGGIRKEIAGGYRLKDGREVGFEIGEYDRSKSLVIDPILVYSTYLGGSGQDEATGVAVDPVGNAYITGFTGSADFPVSAGAFQSSLVIGTCSGGLACNDVFVTKINAEGTAIIYSTFIGGTGQDEARGIAVDPSGNAYVVGRTNSNNFPITAGAFQTLLSGPQFRSHDAFVLKLNADGTAPVYSTYLGGSIDDVGSGIAVDSSGNACVTGETASSNFPLANALQKGHHGDCRGGGDVFIICDDAFVTKLNSAGTGLIFSTFFGGFEEDKGTGIAVDKADNIYVTGVTTSHGLLTTPGAFQTSARRNFLSGDAFVLKLNPQGSAYIYSTYLGGEGGDLAYSIAADEAGNAYVTGETYSTDFPVTAGAFQSASSSGTIYRSDDAGDNWRGAFAGLPSSLTVRAIIVDPVNPANLYVGTSSGVYKSTDGGGSWKPTAPLPGTSFDLAIDPQKTSTIYAANSGVFKSAKSGKKWKAADDGITAPAVLSLIIDPAKTSTLYAGTEDGLFKTTNGGKTWSDVTKGLPLRSVYALAINPKNPSTVYAFSGQPRFSGHFRFIEGGSDAFVTKINAAGSALVYSTYLGGPLSDGGRGIAVDTAGNAYVTGYSVSDRFPTRNGLMQHARAEDAIITKLNAAGTAVIYSTYLGGVQPDIGARLAVDTAGNAYIVGVTNSLDFPTVNPIRSVDANSAFVVKIIDSDLSVLDYNPVNFPAPGMPSAFILRYR
jgi:beta-propeller repeat-containing protein